MNLFGLSAERLLEGVGLTPVELWNYIVLFIAWSIPNALLGAAVIVPLWCLAYLFLPPRNSYDD